MPYKSYKVAIGGISAALCISILFLTGLVPFSSFLMPAIAGFCLVPLVVEYGRATAITVFVAAALLTPFIVPDYEAAMIFIMLMGYYPVIRPELQNIRPSMVRFLIKHLLFNVTVCLGYLLLIYLFGLNFLLDTSDELVSSSLIALLAIANVVFVLYDMSIQNVYNIYNHILRKRIMTGKRYSHRR